MPLLCYNHLHLSTHVVLYFEKYILWAYSTFLFWGFKVSIGLNSGCHSGTHKNEISLLLIVFSKGTFSNVLESVTSKKLKVYQRLILSINFIITLLPNDFSSSRFFVLFLCLAVQSQLKKSSMRTKNLLEEKVFKFLKRQYRKIT